MEEMKKQAAHYVHDLDVMEKRKINWFARFVHKFRRQDGNPYPPSTMQRIVAGVQRSVRDYHSVAGRLTTVIFSKLRLLV